MRDVAARAGVHQTTVSLALRDHPSISAATRRRIREVAEQLGYRPNPLLSAFNLHRIASHPAKGAPTVAMIFDAQMDPRAPGHAYARLLLDGARSAAAERGYRVEPFVLNEGGLHERRLARVLATRGITAVVFSTLGLHSKPLELDWPRLSAVKIESLQVRPALNAVSADQWQAARLGLRRLRALGYRRVGLAVAREDEQRLGEPFRTGVLVEQASMPERDRVASLVFNRPDPNLRHVLAQWVREQRVDAVMSNWNNMVELLRGAGLRVPEDVGVASLDLPSAGTELAGVEQNHRLVGRRAVRQVLMQLQAHQLGLPEMASVTFVPGCWREGASAPLRAAKAT